MPINPDNPFGGSSLPTFGGGVTESVLHPLAAIILVTAALLILLAALAPEAHALGANSCQGANACTGADTAMIGDNSCNGDNACPYLRPRFYILNNACNGDRASAIAI